MAACPGATTLLPPLIHHASTIHVLPTTPAKAAQLNQNQLGKLRHIFWLGPGEADLWLGWQ